jgi:transcriptional antiterminator NusG
MNDTNKKWYVAFVGDQKRISALPAAIKSVVLDSAVWIPEKKVYLKIRGKNRELLRPLFPGYVFINVDIEAGQVEEAIQTSCGGHLLKHPGCSYPASLSDSEMKHIRKVADDKSSPQSIADRYELEIGQKVEITTGPFLGIVGKIQYMKKDKVVVEVSVFGRDVLAEVDPASCFVIKE